MAEELHHFPAGPTWSVGITSYYLYDLDSFTPPTSPQCVSPRSHGSFSLGVFYILCGDVPDVYPPKSINACHPPVPQHRVDIVCSEIMNGDISSSEDPNVHWDMCPVFVIEVCISVSLSTVSVYGVHAGVDRLLRWMCA